MKRIVLVKITDYQDHIQGSFGLSPDFSGFSSIDAYCKAKIPDAPLETYLLDASESPWLVEKLLREQTPVLGLSFDLRSAKRSRFFAQELREKGYRGEIILGGTQINGAVAEALTRFMPGIYSGFVVGPGEESVARIMAEDEVQDIPNYFSVSDGMITPPACGMQVPDLDQLPFPSLDMIRRSGIDPERVMQSVRTQYGCPGHCVFCYGTDYPLRQMCPARLFSILRYYADQKISRFMFVDDEFTRRDRQENQEILDVLHVLNATHPHLRVRGMVFEAFFRSDSFLLPDGSLDGDLLDGFIRAGLRIPYIGIDAGNLRDIRFYGKALQREGPAFHAPEEWCARTRHFLREFYRFLDERRTPVWPFLGFVHINAHSTPESLRENISFIQENTTNPSPLLFFWPLHPYPTSPIGSQLLNRYIASDNALAALNLIHGQPVYEFDHPVVERYASMVAKLREVFRPQKINSRIMKLALEGNLDRAKAIRLRDTNCGFHLDLLCRAEQGQELNPDVIADYIGELKLQIARS